MEEAYYDHLVYMHDSGDDAIEIQNGNPITQKGLYCIIDGEQVEPDYLWFGCHFYRYDLKMQNYGGMAYYHYNNVLYPVYTKEGEHYRVPQLRNVNADYDNGVIHNFRRG